MHTTLMRARAHTKRMRTTKHNARKNQKQKKLRGISHMHTTHQQTTSFLVIEVVRVLGSLEAAVQILVVRADELTADVRRAHGTLHGLM